MTKSMKIGLCDDGDPPNVWVEQINYENIDGRHIFTSDHIAGLLIISTDPRKALRQLAPAITTLIKANIGVNCTVVLGHEFKDFEKKHTLHTPARDTQISLKNTYAIIKAA